MRCGCKRRSVDAKDLEADFLRLVQLLTLKPEAHDLMLELAMGEKHDPADAENFERQRRAAIAALKQQLVNLLDLYKNAVISAEEYYRDKEDREQQISFWEARTTDTQKKAVELERVMVAFSQLLDLWQTADSDGRSALARGLFQYLVFDLDQQQIVDFRLHPWADQYLMLRADLYGDDLGGDDGGSGGAFEGKDNRSTARSSDKAIVSPNGNIQANHMTWEAIGAADIAARLVWRDTTPTRSCYTSHRHTVMSRIVVDDNSQRVKEIYSELGWLG